MNSVLLPRSLDIPVGSLVLIHRDSLLSSLPHVWLQSWKDLLSGHHGPASCPMAQCHNSQSVVGCCGGGNCDTHHSHPRTTHCGHAIKDSQLPTLYFHWWCYWRVGRWGGGGNQGNPQSWSLTYIFPRCGLPLNATNYSLRFVSGPARAKRTLNEGIVPHRYTYGLGVCLFHKHHCGSLLPHSIDWCDMVQSWIWANACFQLRHYHESLDYYSNYPPFLTRCRNSGIILKSLKVNFPVLSPKADCIAWLTGKVLLHGRLVKSTSG